MKMAALRGNRKCLIKIEIFELELQDLSKPEVRPCSRGANIQILTLWWAHHLHRVSENVRVRENRKCLFKKGFGLEK